MNLTDILQNEGKTVSEEIELSADQLEMPFGTFRILRKDPLSLTVTNKGDDKLQIQGHSFLCIEMFCDRCLEKVPYDMELDFDLEADLRPSGEDGFEVLETYDFLDGYQLDPDRLVRGEALLGWPSRILCSDSCRGLCKKCGQNLNLGDCQCDKTDLDPRMAKIRDFFS